MCILLKQCAIMAINLLSLNRPSRYTFFTLEDYYYYEKNHIKINEIMNTSKFYKVQIYIYDYGYSIYKINASFIISTT